MGFAVRDISSWVVMSQEARGLDPKDWVVPPNEVERKSQEHWWLFKPIKPAGYRRYDDWSERLAAALANLVGLPAATVELAQGRADAGIISLNVTPDRWSMDSGDTLLSEFEGYVSCAGDVRPRNRVGHNLSNILKLLEGCDGPPGSECGDWSAAEVFAGYLVFDAWIANTDRHAINWSVLTCVDDGRRALAPTFDHGSALASGTQDERLERVAVSDFAERGFAGRFENGGDVTLVELALAAVELVGGRAQVWLRRLADIAPDEVDLVLAEIDGMSVVRRRFLSSLLETNRGRLTT